MSLTRTQTQLQSSRPGLSQSPSPQVRNQGTNAPLRIRPTFRGGRTLILDMPIGQRLTMGFLLAALIAALVAGLVGVQRSQSLSRQSEFYQALLRSNTSLTTGANFLQLMNTETGALIEAASASQPSKETIKQDENAIKGLIDRYDTTLKTYMSQDLVSKHQSQVELLEEGGNGGQVRQQETLAASAQRTWQVYRASLEQVLSSVDAGHITEAQNFSRVQAEPTNGDAISALRALIQLNQRLSNSINAASSVEEQQQLLTTIVGSILAFIAIALVGWFISGTLVRRLRHLLHVTQAVEQGNIQARVEVVGRDEIGSVSASTNAMLNAISDLLQETRLQRDALTNAAEHLFTNIRVVNAGDLRINAPVSNDPIGMLANAFNFTVGRFRRFVMRVQTVMEQLEAVSRHEIERAEQFTSVLHSLDENRQTPLVKTSRTTTEEKSGQLSPQAKEMMTHFKSLRERLQGISNDNHQRRLQSVLSMNEQIMQVTDRLQKLLSHETGNRGGIASGSIHNGLAAMHVQELRTLETQAQRMYKDFQHTQWQLGQQLQEIDKDLAQLASEARTLGTQDGTESSAISPEEREELLRTGSVFVGDVLSTTRKLQALSQEIRVNMISFQLEGSEEVNSHSRFVSGAIQDASLQRSSEAHRPVRTTSGGSNRHTHSHG